MKCRGCSSEMTSMTMDRRLGGQETIDVCAGCQAFWFDHFESLALSAGSTLKLIKFIGEHSSPTKPSLRTRSVVRDAQRCCGWLTTCKETCRSLTGDAGTMTVTSSASSSS